MEQTETLASQNSESNEEVKVEPATENAVAEKPEPQTETPAVETPEEPSIELDGQRLTAAQIKEMKDAYDNKEKWTKANTQRAQEIAAERKRLERLSLLEEAVQKRPDILQELFKPRETRNFDVEVQNLYRQRPQDVFSPEYQQWEMQKDLILAQKAAEEGSQKARAEIFEAEAREHNQRIGEEKEKELRGKGLDDNDIAQIGQFVVDNFKPVNGKYQAKFFDMAYQALHADETIRQAKLDTAKEIGRTISKAKPASESPGINKKQEPKSPIDEADDAFVRYVHERGGR